MNVSVSEPVTTPERDYAFEGLLDKVGELERENQCLRTELERLRAQIEGVAHTCYTLAKR